MQIRKAVIPAAGWGVRFLPVTKAVPKAMLPLVDRPLIQYAVEEAVSSGIDEIIIVTSPSHTAIEAHFKPSPDLERALEQKGEDRMLDTVRRVSSMAHIRYVSQTEQLGLGHAILIARALIGDEPFAVLLPDDIFDAHVPLVRQLLDVYHRYDECVIALWRVHSQETSRYGIATPERVEDGVHRVLGTVEKPDPADAPSDLAILGRYVLSPAIFQALT
ncbi:MAG: UTP--glucose-1-phosphate uridylyltransferase, partial [Chloroflexota bacterium]